jgi:steroid delta-isomerase
MAQAPVVPPRSADSRVQRVVTLYQSLNPDDLQWLGRVYSEQAKFKDPFNTVQGLPAITAIFSHMFATLDAPRFAVIDAVAAGDDAFLTWDFSFRSRGAGAQALCIHGASHLRFGPDGRVLMHRDYWDAAEELYEKLPVIGALMRWLKRRASR